jgi:dolichol-phosphate mannosyltransferase
MMKAIVIIPTYNERGNVQKLVKELLGLGLDVDLLFVDDHSPDGTGELLDEIALQNPAVSVIHRPGKLGLGTAYLTGYQAALARNPDYILQMDADLSHDPRDIPKLIAAAERDDLVIGSRYVRGGGIAHWSMGRLLLSYCANLYVRLMTGLKIRDSTSGFRCFNRSVLERIGLDRVDSNGYAFQIEMAYRTLSEGFRIVEVPIIFLGRSTGKSKLSRKIIWEALFLPWKILLGLIR